MGATVEAVILCQSCERDPDTEMYAIGGIYQNVAVSEFPGVAALGWLYCAIHSDGEPAIVVTEIVLLGEISEPRVVVCSAEAKVPHLPPGQVFEFVQMLPTLSVDGPKVFVVVLQWNGVEIARRSFLVLGDTAQ